MKNINKYLIALLATLVLSLSFGVVAEAASFEKEFGKWLGDAFDVGGNQGISFTQYEGQLTELGEEGYDSALTTTSDAREYVLRIVNFALGFLGLIAVLIVIYGGVLYVTAAGEEEKTTTGKKAITYAAIGLLIVLGSFAFVNTVIRGATGNEQGGGAPVVVGSSGRVFNASAEQVRAIAVDIFNGFAYLAQSTEEIQNILNDADKDSLKSENLPSKSDIISFLVSVKSKLNNMRNKLPAFSETGGLINDYIRDIDKDIDSLEVLTAVGYVNKQGDECDPDEGGFSEGFEEGVNSQGQNICEIDGYVRYPVGLYAKWKEIKEKFVPGSDFAEEIIKSIAADYKAALLNNLDALQNIYDSVKNIEAISGGKAQAAYTTMMNQYGYPNSSLSETVLKKLDNWDSTINISATGAMVVEALKQQALFYDELSGLQYVKAKITADVTEGNAPLTVIFDTFGTVDPAGGSVQGSNIVWDLAGVKKINDLEKDANASNLILPADGSMTCDFTTNATAASAKEFIGTTAKRCTFNYPGTYQAAIKIYSNDPKKYAPGISVITIKVRPPTTKIELNMESGTNKQQVMHYEGEVLAVDKKNLIVTLKEAQDGIKFDASKTKASQYKWTFGNGKVQEFSTNDKAEVEYDKVGKYEVSLEVLSQLGVLDRKLFTIQVAGVAARIRSDFAGVPSIGNPVIFDGSASKSDLGTIKQYEWEINPSPGQTLPKDIGKSYPLKRSGANVPTLTHEFKYPLNYDITLTITDSTGQTSTDQVTNFKVESKAPVAEFDALIGDETQPGTYRLDSSRSFDPDGVNEFLAYEWTITPDKNWSFAQGTTKNSQIPVVKFNKKGEYKITLKVTDFLTSGTAEESSQISKNLKIENILDVAWAENQKVTEIIDDEGRAEVDFKILSDNAIAYEIDFGDGDSTSGDIKGAETISHTYTKAGKYDVLVTVYDEDDNDNSIERRIFIGGGDVPVAKARILVNGAEIADSNSPIDVTKADILTFDASDSKNVDGTARKLKYSWNFGDTKQSSNKVATHSYKELSPKEKGYYVVKLTVSDRDNADLTAEDEIKINVVNKAPKFSAIQATPQSGSSEMITPVAVNVRAFGAEDEDGEITQYRWWYYDTKNPDEPLGIQITTQPNSKLTLGTKGKEGQKVTYGFGLEITDNDNLKVSSSDILTKGKIPTLTVTNGPNELPTAKFTVDSPKIFTGEKVTFSSASKDPDGKIVSYIWDFEGDGFFNNAPTTKSTIEYTYNDKNLNGYRVRLKVIDDKAGESISEPITIYVDSLAKPPTAAFTYEIVDGSAGKKIRFKNNSKVDAEAGAKIVSYKWDFDTDSTYKNADSDGDGIKDNDSDATDSNPDVLYTENGSYKVKLTVTDSNGAKDDVVNIVDVISISKVPIQPDKLEDPSSDSGSAGTGTTGGANLSPSLSASPGPAQDGIIYIVGEKGSVTFDFSKSAGPIATYIFDKNIYFDTDGDGIKNNDNDFKTTLPGTWKTNFEKAWGKIVAKFTVVDIYGNEKSLLQEIMFK